MKKQLIHLFILFPVFIFLFTTLVSGQNVKYSEVTVNLNGKTLSDLAATGIAADEGIYSKEGFVKLVLSQDELAQIAKAGFTWTVLHDDYTQFISDRNQAMQGEIERINQKIKSRTFGGGNYGVPQGFELGTMGGFYTLEQIWAEMDSLHNEYPDLVSAKSEFNSTKSIEGRPLYYLKISDNPNTNEDEPKVFYNALTHAREPMGMQQLFFFMNYLLEHYATDPEIQYLLNNVELYFIPVMNPDGYYQNEQNAPYGGGNWRKNKRNNGDGTYGVDLNRNYGYKWGYDDVGSSPNTFDETYRGTGPFSEPETQIVRDFADDKNFKLAINYHTYANLLLYPWCYITQQTNDSNVFRSYAELMVRDNAYRSGMPGAVLYNTNGDINDWLYGDITNHPKVFTFSPEIGGDNDGFWPLASHIIPLAQENMLANLLVAHLSYRYAEAYDESPVIIANRQGYFHFMIRRYGLDNQGEYTVTIQPLDTSVITQVGGPKTFTTLMLLDSETDSIGYTLSPDLVIGSEFKFLLQVNNGFYTHSDTITKYFGPPLIVFSDSCNDFSNWTSPKWNYTQSQYYSPPGSITDSPSGNYSNNENNSVTLKVPVDLRDSPVAAIEYRAKWNTEQGFDYVQVKATTGVGYIPLTGKYTHPGGDNEPSGQPLYDGLQADWVPEQIVTTGFVDKDITLRFTMTSDTWTTYDGFYFDDLKVTIIDMSSVGVDDHKSEPSWISNPVPNPSGGMVRISYRLPDSFSGQGTLILSNLNGSEMKRIPVNSREGTLSFDVTELAQGLYYYRIEAPGAATGVKKLVVVR